MNVGFAFQSVLLEFLGELYIFYALTMYRLARRRSFVLRFLAGAAVMLVVARLAAMVYPAVGSTVLGRTGVYLLLFACSVGHVCFCLEEPAELVVLLCGVAYAAQNLCYKLYLIVWCTGDAMGLYDGWGNWFDLNYHLMYYALLALGAAGVYFFFLRRLGARITDRRIDYRMFAVTALALAVTVVLCSVEDIYFARLSTFRENRFDRWEFLVLRQSGNVFSVICCGIVLLLASKTIESRALEQEVAYLQYAIRQGQWQYEMSKDTIELINIKCHDIKYKLAALAGGPMGPEAWQDLEKSINIYDMKVETGNKLLDVLLTEKSLYCEQNGIRFSCLVDGEKLSFLEDGDRYCLFGNIVDNALEAVRAVEERQKRVVNLIVRAQGDMVTIQADNYYQGDLTFRDGLPLTTKADASSHGFGMRSIRMLVQKYGGAMTASARDGVFHLNILLSPTPEKR